MRVFTVHSYRWGDRENHSYSLGVYSSEEKAKAVAEHELDFRGGKYECEILEWDLDGQITRVVQPLFSENYKLDRYK